MAELQTEINPQDGQISNDVAGTIRVASQTTGGEIIVTDGKTLSNREGFVNVRDYGAVGDAVTDDTQAFIDAIEACRNSKRSLYIPAGKYFLNSVPDDGFNMVRPYPKTEANIYFPGEPNDPLAIAVKPSISVLGEHTTTTQLIWGNRNTWSVLFTHVENFRMGNLTITDVEHKNWKAGGADWSKNRDVKKGVVVATPFKSQQYMCNFHDLNIFGEFRYAFYARVSIVDTYERIYTAGPLVHYCFACGNGDSTLNSLDRTAATFADRAKSMSKPNVFTANWNGGEQNSWFHNCVSMKMIHIEGGEIGIFGPLKGLTIDMLTTENMWRSSQSGNNTPLNLATDGDSNCVLLGQDEPAVGLYLHGQGTSGSAFLNMNTVTAHYTEVCQRGLKAVKSQVKYESAGLYGIWHGTTGDRQYHKSFVYLSNSDCIIDTFTTHGDRNKVAILDNNSTLVVNVANGFTESDVTCNSGSKAAVGNRSLPIYLNEKANQVAVLEGTIATLTSRLAAAETKISKLMQATPGLPSLPSEDSLLINLTPDELKDATIKLGNAPKATELSYTPVMKWGNSSSGDISGEVLSDLGSVLSEFTSESVIGVDGTDGGLYIGRNKTGVGFDLGNISLSASEGFTIQVTYKMLTTGTDWAGPLWMHSMDYWARTGLDFKGESGKPGIRTENSGSNVVVRSGNGTNGKVIDFASLPNILSGVANGDLHSIIISVTSTGATFYADYNTTPGAGGKIETTYIASSGGDTAEYSKIGFNGKGCGNMMIKEFRVWKGFAATDSDIAKIRDMSISLS